MFNAIDGSSTIGRNTHKQCGIMRHAMLSKPSIDAQAILVDHIANLMMHGPRYKLRETIIYANPSDIVMQLAAAKAMRKTMHKHNGPKHIAIVCPSILSNDASIKQYPQDGETGLPIRKKREVRPVKPILSKKAQAMQKVLERMELDLY